MTCGTADNSGEKLRSLLTLCSPTSVPDVTGNTDDVATGTNFSVGNPRFNSAANEAPSSFRRFGAGAGGSDGSVDGSDGKFLGLQVWSLAGCAPFAGADIGFPVLARGKMILGKNEDYHGDGGARRINPGGRQTAYCISRRFRCLALHGGC